MKIEIIRLIISNLIAVINFILLCYSQATIERRDYLKVKSVSMVLMIVVYLVSGLWISVFSNIATVIRNMYNAKAKKPRLWINIIICLVTVVFCFVGSGGIERLDWISMLPLISLVFYSIAIMVVKSRIGMAIVDSVDALMWVGYDVSNLLVMNVVTDFFNILMGAGHPLLAFLDKKYIFVKKKEMENML